jgi:hypothetical protein
MDAVRVRVEREQRFPVSGAVELRVGGPRERAERVTRERADRELDPCVRGVVEPVRHLSS